MVKLCVNVGDANRDGSADAVCNKSSDVETPELVLELGIEDEAENAACCYLENGKRNNGINFCYRGPTIFFDEKGIPFFVGQNVIFGGVESKIEGFAILLSTETPSADSSTWAQKVTVRAVLSGCIMTDLEGILLFF